MLARQSDPSTSHRAAREVVHDGTAASMERKALKLIRNNPGQTANELEAMVCLKDGQLRKRLSALQKRGCLGKGPARHSRITGKRNQTWHITEFGMSQA